MINIRQLVVTLIIFFLILPVSVVTAGSSQATGERHHDQEVLVEFAKKVEKIMAEKGARVALLARVGRDRKELPKGINFTHVGIAVYSQINTADGRQIPGYSVYNLYQRAEDPQVSELIQDFPVDFFAGVEVLEAGIIIPTPELQRRIVKVLASPTYKKLHNPHYSVIANPFTLEFQNCTEHTLDVITAAIYQTNNIQVIKANQRQYFTPQPVRINPIKLKLGSLFVADVSTSDHPRSPVTTTFTTIGKFLSKYNAATEVITVLPNV